MGPKTQEYMSERYPDLYDSPKRSLSPTKVLDPETRYFTQGFSDIQPSEEVDRTVERVYAKPLVKSPLEEFRLSKLLRRRIFPFFSQLLDSKETIMSEELEQGMLGAFEQQQDISLQARERLSKNQVKYVKNQAEKGGSGPLGATRGKWQTTLLEEQIAHRNVLEEILSLKGRYHSDYYDLLFHPKTGVMMKPESELTEYEKNHVLGYSQDIRALGKIEPHKLAKKLMKNNENFVNWFYLGGKESAINVEVDGKVLPKLIHHATLGKVSPVIGFWDRHMGMDERVLAGIMNIEKEAEKSSHFGTLNQAVDIVLNKGGKEELETYGRSKWDTLHNAIYYPDKVTNEAKFYSGWIKMNNPLRMKDLKVFEFDRILQQLSLDGLMPDFSYDILSPESPKFNKWQKKVGDSPTEKKDDLFEGWKQGTRFPLLKDYFGQGTALENVLNYAREFYEKDMNKAGLELDDWNQEWGNMSGGEQAAIHYYKMHGLIKFINKDLNYDGIIYENEVEDSTSESDSYILFHPWQFKSMYNKGSFSKKRNFLGKTESKNKYQKVA